MLFSKKKKKAAAAKQVASNADVGMIAIQEFLNRGPGTMKDRGGKSGAHILSEHDGAAADTSKLLGMRLAASEIRFRGCSHSWSDSIRQQFVANQQMLLAHAEKSNYYSLRGDPPASEMPRATLSSYSEQESDAEDGMRERQMLSIMADGLQLFGDAMFAMFASDVRVERRVLVQDLICEDLAEHFAWGDIQSLEAAEVQNSRVDNAALTFAVFCQFASRCSSLVQESARACRAVVLLGGVIPLVRMCQDPPCAAALIDSLAALVSLLSSDSGRAFLFDFGGFEAIQALLSSWLDAHISFETQDKSSVSLSDTCEVDEQNTLFLLKGALNCIIGLCTGAAVYRARLLDLGCAGVLFSVLRRCSVDAVLRLAATAVVALGCDEPLGDSSLSLSHDDIGLFDGVDGRLARDADSEDERAASEPPPESYMAIGNLPHSSFQALHFLNQAARHAVAAAFDSVLDSTASLGRRPASSASSVQALPPMQARNRTVLQERNNGAKLFGGGMRAPDRLFPGNSAKQADDAAVHPSIEEARARSKAASARSRAASSVAGQNTIQTASSASQDMRSIRVALLEGHQACSARVASVGAAGTEALCALLGSENCSNALLAQCCSCLCLMCKMSEPNRECVCALGAIPPIVGLLRHKNSRCVAAATAVMSVLTKSSACRKAIAACVTSFPRCLFVTLWQVRRRARAARRQLGRRVQHPGHSVGCKRSRGKCGGSFTLACGVYAARLRATQSHVTGGGAGESCGRRGHGRRCQCRARGFER